MHFSFSKFFSVSRHIPVPTVCVSHFTRFFSVSRHIPVPTVCVSHFTRFFSVSRHIPAPTVCVSHFARFSVFSPHSRSYHVSFSFSSFVRFLAIFQVQQCVCLIFHVFDFLALFQVLSCALFIFHIFQFSGHIPGPTVCVSHFARLKVFLAIFWVLEFAFLSFHFFLCFSPYSRSYSVCFSFCTFFSVSRHIPGPKCVFLIFLVGQFSHHTQGPIVCISRFPRFWVFLAIFQDYFYRL